MTRFARALPLSPPWSASPRRSPAPRGRGPTSPTGRSTPRRRDEVIDGVLKALNADYVFPETAKKMEEAIRDRLEKKEYDGITSAREFAADADRRTCARSARTSTSASTTRTTRSASRPAPRSPAARTRPDDARRCGEPINFGFEKVERLPGNVGYLELRGFFPAEFGGDTAAAAMNFLANTDALIIDLRQNGGGAPSMVALLCSYLFDPQPVHLNDLYFRPDDSTHQWWTLPYVPGKRFEEEAGLRADQPQRTFSAAEEFTYNLKNQKRATIVGETTGGGAHPGGVKRITEHFGVFVPTGRAINPISKRLSGKPICP